jgi:hypothetical protein
MKVGMNLVPWTRAVDLPPCGPAVIARARGCLDCTRPLDHRKREFGGLSALRRGHPGEGLRLLHRRLIAERAMRS